MSDEMFCCDCNAPVTGDDGRFEGTDDEGTPIFEALCPECGERHRRDITATQPDGGTHG